MVAKPIADGRYNGTHHWADFDEKEIVAENVQCLLLSNVENAKCTYASIKNGIISSNFIIKKLNVFTEPEHHLDVLNFFG